jgi:hypothetical protein
MRLLRRDGALSTPSPSPSVSTVADTLTSPADKGGAVSGAVRWPRPLWVARARAAGSGGQGVAVPGVPAKHAGLVGRLAALMTGICPQRPSHSYTLGGVQLPLEARMMGMFGGLAVGVLELATFGRKRSQRWPRRPVALALLLGLGVMALDGINALFFDVSLPHAYTPDLRLRLATGVLAGAAMAFGLVPALAQVETHDDVVASDARPGWRDMGWALLGSGGVALLIASGWSPLLDPLALLGVGGVVLTFTLINRVVLAGLRGERGAGTARMRHDWWLGGLAAGLAVGELVLFAALYSRFVPR